MKSKRQISIIMSVLILIIILGYIIIAMKDNPITGLDQIILILIIILATIFLINSLKNTQNEKKGLPIDDELSNRIKYKAGNKTYMISMYMWLFIFLLKDKFPNNEIMLGGGIMLSALIFVITKYIVKRNFHE